MAKKVVVCTGANGGIGQHFCREMLAKGFHVVMACRNEESGQQVLHEMQQEFPEGSIELMLVDMGSLQSINQFAHALLSKFSRLDVLAHNAGIYFFDKQRRLSAEGIELNLAVHVVGPFALTAKLLPLLKATLDSKVINMSSTEHQGAAVDLADIQMEREFSELGNAEAYARSKWAGLALTYELSRRLPQHGYNVSSLAAHPGISITGIQHKGNPTLMQRAAIWLFGKFLAASPEEAAQPLVMASIQGKGGQFYGPTGFKQFKGPAGLVEPDLGARERAAGEAIWQEIERLSGVRFFSVAEQGVVIN